MPMFITETGRERILTLAAKLDTVADVHFDMGRWFRCVEINDEMWTEVLAAFNPQNECGYEACAAGHAASIPEFQALGYFVTASGVYYGGKEDVEALALFFEIPVGAAVELFHQHGYSDQSWNTPKGKAAQLRDFARDPNYVMEEANRMRLNFARYGGLPKWDGETYRPLPAQEG